MGVGESEDYDGVFRLDLTDPPTESSMACPGDLPPKIISYNGTLAAQDSAFPGLDGLSYEFLLWSSTRWSPRGDEVAIRVEGPELDRDGNGLGGNALVVADPSNVCDPTCQALVPIYHQEDAVIQGFDWSPDGTELLILCQVFLSDTEWRYELAIVDRESGGVLDSWFLDSVTPEGVYMSSPAWAPTVPEGYFGPVVAFHQSIRRNRGGPWERRLYLLDLGVPDPMAVQIGLGSQAAWSPDVRFLAVRGDGTSDPQRIEVATGAVVDLGDFQWASFWSPDWKPASATVCGNESCEGSENKCNCEEDCGVPPVIEDSCTDGVDNNCDGLTDCDDPFCATYPSCLCEDLELICDNDIDNDCDTDIDCFGETAAS